MRKQTCASMCPNARQQICISAMQNNQQVKGIADFGRRDREGECLIHDVCWWACGTRIKAHCTGWLWSLNQWREGHPGQANNLIILVNRSQKWMNGKGQPCWGNLTKYVFCNDFQRQKHNTGCGFSRKQIGFVSIRMCMCVRLREKCKGSVLLRVISNNLCVILCTVTGYLIVSFKRIAYFLYQSADTNCLPIGCTVRTKDQGNACIHACIRFFEPQSPVSSIASIKHTETQTGSSYFTYRHQFVSTGWLIFPGHRLKCK